MAMLASKTPFPTSLSSASTLVPSSNAPSAPPASRRAPLMAPGTQPFASPTESDFADAEGPDSAKNWDEDRVCDYLRSINCGDYI